MSSAYFFDLVFFVLHIMVVLLFFIGYKPVLSGSKDLVLSIVSVHKDNCRACITLFYRPHSSPFCTFGTILRSLNPALFSNFVLFGDFNIDFL